MSDETELTWKERYEASRWMIADLREDYRKYRARVEREEQEVLGLLRELVADSGWGFRPPPVELEDRVQALVERAGQAGAHPAESERCGFSADGRHRRGTGRDRNECADCDTPMRPAESDKEN